MDTRSGIQPTPSSLACTRPSSSFPGSISTPPYSLDDTFEVSQEAAGQLDLGALGARLQLSPYTLGAGRALCCEVPDDDYGCGFGPFETCISEEDVQLPELAWDGVPEAWRPFTLVRTWSGEYTEDQSLWSGWYGSPYDPAGIPIAVPSDEYCLRIEVLDLRDGSVHPATECVAYVELDTYTRENDLEAFVKKECNGSTAFWEDSGEPFEPEAQGCAIDGTRTGWGGVLALVVLLRLRRRRLMPPATPRRASR